MEGGHDQGVSVNYEYCCMGDIYETGKEVCLEFKVDIEY